MSFVVLSDLDPGMLSFRVVLYSVADLLELRKLRRAKEGIDSTKLSKGDVKKKRKRPVEPEDQGGLKKGAEVHEDEEYVSSRCVGHFLTSG